MLVLDIGNQRDSRMGLMFILSVLSVVSPTMPAIHIERGTHAKSSQTC